MEDTAEFFAKSHELRKVKLFSQFSASFAVETNSFIYDVSPGSLRPGGFLVNFSFYRHTHMLSWFYCKFVIYPGFLYLMSSTCFNIYHVHGLVLPKYSKHMF